MTYIKISDTMLGPTVRAYKIRKCNLSVLSSLTFGQVLGERVSKKVSPESEF